MYDASADTIGATITREKPSPSTVTLDAARSDAIALWEAYEGNRIAVTSDAIQPRPERRRPGRRIANTNEALIPLLRANRHLLQDSEAALQDDMAPANGILAGLLISGVFWLAIFFLLR